MGRKNTCRAMILGAIAAITLLDRARATGLHLGISQQEKDLLMETEHREIDLLMETDHQEKDLLMETGHRETGLHLVISQQEKDHLLETDHQAIDLPLETEHREKDHLLEMDHRAIDRRLEISHRAIDRRLEISHREIGGRSNPKAIIPTAPIREGQAIQGTGNDVRSEGQNRYVKYLRKILKTASIAVFFLRHNISFTGKIRLFAWF
jgi:hypothetical protein